MEDNRDDINKKKHFDLIDIKLMLTLAGAGCIIGIFYIMIGHIGSFFEMLKKFISAMSPIIIGGVIAFLLNPIVNRLRMGLNDIFKKLMPKLTKKKRKKLTDVLSVVFAMLFFLALIAGLLWILIPSLYDSINKLYENFDKYTTNLETWVTKLAKKNPNIVNILNNYMDDIEKSVKNLFTDKLIPNMDGVVKAVSSGIVGGVKFVFDFIVGIVAAIYILGSKDKFSAQGKKVIYAIFNKRKGNRILSVIEFVDGIFSGFISGKIVDSMIIGAICFVFCSIVNMPYAVLISVIIGVTNIIPFFGPFIGAIPAAVLVLVESPKMCLVFVIFIIILQQLDGNVIGPLVLADTTGLSSFWILFAILVGGNLFGFKGMVLGVPAFACIYALMTRLLRDGLSKKGLINDTSYFVALRGFDEEGNPIRGPKKVFESASAKRKREKQMEQLKHSKELINKVTRLEKGEKKDKED